jgi:circadian clock protein KaiB
MKSRPLSRSARNERLKKPRRAPLDHYVLKLYVTGLSARSLSAIRSIKRICKEHLHARYRLEIIDLYRQPGRAKDEQIIAAPTLVKHLPLPLRRLIGDLANEPRVLTGLDVTASNEVGPRS